MCTSVTECGHSGVCESCLVDWFTGALRTFRDDVNPHYQPYHAAPYISDNVIARMPAHVQVQLYMQKDLQHPNYSCPQCRVEIRVPPCESFTIKSLVALYAKAAGEKDPGEVSRGKKAKKGKAVAVMSVWEPFFGKV